LVSGISQAGALAAAVIPVTVKDKILWAAAGALFGGTVGGVGAALLGAAVGAAVAACVGDDATSLPTVTNTAGSRESLLGAVSLTRGYASSLLP